jgi:aminoglycoside phosphotransferase (APT) family kinase protein
VTQEPWTAEVDVDATLAARLIARQFPELADLAVTALGEGWDNAAFLAGGRFVFRFPRRTIAAGLIETEMGALPAIARRVPLPIPEPRFRGVPDEAYPWPFAGYALLPGDALSSALLDERSYRQVANDMGEFLRALHAIDPATVAGLDLDRIGRLDRERGLPKALDRLDALRGAGIIDDVSDVLTILRAEDDPRLNTPLAVVHGDLYARHVLLDSDNRVCGVIDWGDVHLGDPAVDLAVAFESLPPAVRHAFAEAYGHADEITWQRARWRGAYHSAMVAHYGMCIGDDELLRAGLDGLSWCRV